jgi:hypothetical protein
MSASHINKECSHLGSLRLDGTPKRSSSLAVYSLTCSRGLARIRVLSLHCYSPPEIIFVNSPRYCEMTFALQTRVIRGPALAASWCSRR